MIDPLAGGGRREAGVNIPFAVGRLKGDFTEIVLVGEDGGPVEASFIREGRMARTPGRYRPRPRRSATRPA